MVGYLYRDKQCAYRSGLRLDREDAGEFATAALSRERRSAAIISMYRDVVIHPRCILLGIVVAPLSQRATSPGGRTTSLDRRGSASSGRVALATVESGARASSESRYLQACVTVSSDREATMHVPGNSGGVAPVVLQVTNVPVLPHVGSSSNPNLPSHAAPPGPAHVTFGA